MLNDHNEIIEIHAIVNGNVQGVGFRFTAQHHASRLQLSGTVRNMPDGTVEMFVKGPKKTIEALMQTIRKEFDISSITQREINPQHPYTSFRIL